MALKMTPRDIHRICGKLREDRLLKMCVLKKIDLFLCYYVYFRWILNMLLFVLLNRATRMEARKQDQRPVPKTYYYLDYKEFVDVVKWKMYKMQTNVRDNLRTVNYLYIYHFSSSFFFYLIIYSSI